MGGGAGDPLALASAAGRVAVPVRARLQRAGLGGRLSLATKPEPDDVLMEFYRTIRPWGFWKPILEKCRAQTPQLEPNRDCLRDWFNVITGIVWQIAMFAAPIYFVIKQWPRFWLWTAVLAVTSVILKFTWYDKLGKGQGYLTV